MLKVKEPVASEYHLHPAGPGALHLPAPRRRPALTDALIDSGATAIAYETVQLPDRSLPLLSPMCEVAGRLSPRSARTT